MGSKFSFGGQTWVQVSSKFNLSSSKFFKVHFNTSFDSSRGSKFRKFGELFTFLDQQKWQKR